MYVESERRVSALHGHHRAGEGLRHARKPVLSLRAPAEGAVHLFHEPAHNLSAELSVIAEQREQSPGPASKSSDGWERGARRALRGARQRRPMHEGQKPRCLHEKTTSSGVAAFAALEAQAAPVQAVTVQVPLELLDHEPRQAAARVGTLPERGPVLGDRLIQRRVFATMAEARAIRDCESVRGVTHALRWLATSVPGNRSAKTQPSAAASGGEVATRHWRAPATRGRFQCGPLTLRPRAAGA